MGLGDQKEWSFETRTNRHQFSTYRNNGAFKSYLVYKSNLGLQGILYGLADQVLPIPGDQNLSYSASLPPCCLQSSLDS